MFKFSLLSLFILTMPPAVAGEYYLYHCDDENQCDLLQQGNIDEFDNAYDFHTLAAEKNRAASALASGLGIGYKAADTIITGLRRTAIRAGYTDFTAVLSGPNGKKATFKMNLDTGDFGFWTGGFRAGGSNGNGGKVRIK